MLTRILLAVVFGLVGGSFITALSFRSPKGKSIADGRSCCPICGHVLSWKDLFPVFSWLMLKGKCRYCSGEISARYPIIELATVILFVIIAFVISNPVHAILLSLITVFLIALVVADIETGLLPTSIIATLLPFAIIYRWQVGGDVVAGLIGGCAGIGFAMLLRYGFQKIKNRECLGLGDVRFLGIAGVLLSLEQCGVFLFVAGVAGVFTGLLWKKLGKGDEFPFAPALILSLFLCLIFPEI